MVVFLSTLVVSLRFVQTGIRERNQLRKESLLCQLKTTRQPIAAPLRKVGTRGTPQSLMSYLPPTISTTIPAGQFTGQKGSNSSTPPITPPSPISTLQLRTRSLKGTRS